MAGSSARSLPALENAKSASIGRVMRHEAKLACEAGILRADTDVETSLAIEPVSMNQQHAETR